jgi:hypothetical protein
VLLEEDAHTLDPLDRRPERFHLLHPHGPHGVGRVRVDSLAARLADMECLVVHAASMRTA